jgi:ABC-2 type transport system ATP-binding protein
MSDVAVEAQDLRRSFGDNEAVAGVDLAVREGEVYGFLGPNGAGKSTTVRMLCTLLSMTGGRASVAGFDVASQADDVRLRIGVALQDAALDPKQTGRELLRLQARLYGLHRDEVDTRVDELIGMIDIGDALDDRVGTYSGGMKRRLDLAAALVHNPEVLFLDEPTTGLDPVSRNRVWEEVRELNTEHGVTIFLTTQYLEEADALADRVGIIVKGEIAAEGTPTELKRRIGTDVIVVRVDGDVQAADRAVREVEGVSSTDVHDDEITIAVDDGAALVSKVAVALDGDGVAVRDLTLRSPSLDDVFLELTGGRFRADDEPTGEEDAR